jgi:hypothetical protein
MLKGATGIRQLFLYKNNLREVDLSDQSSLLALRLSNNKELETIIWGRHPELWELNMGYTSYNKPLDLRLFPNLWDLDLSGNVLGELDLSKCDSLRELRACESELHTLILGDKPYLKGLYVYGNSLQELNLSGCPSLEYLYVNHNALKELDLDALFISVVTTDAIAIKNTGLLNSELGRFGIKPRLIINRFKRTVANGNLVNIDDIIDSSKARLIGIVPEDSLIVKYSRKPIVFGKAAMAFNRIASRLNGNDVKLPKVKDIL